MIGVLIKFVDNSRRVVEATAEAGFRNLRHAAASIRKYAIESIEPHPEPSLPGTPPHTRPRTSRKGKQLKGHLQRAITFDATDSEAVIGPRESIVGTSGKAHEFGGEYKGETYPERPFMFPAMEANLNRFAGDWAGSIGE